MVLGLLVAALGQASTSSPSRPSGPLVYGDFTGTFSDAGVFSIALPGWPGFSGPWPATGSELLLATTDTKTPGCETPGRFRIEAEGSRFTLTAIEDKCSMRRTLFDGSVWRPQGSVVERVPRKIVTKLAPKVRRLGAPGDSAGSWPSFRGRDALGRAEGQALPDSWDVASGASVRWRQTVPGLAHSSPVVWGDRVFVTSALSALGKATFRPGLYGDGDASEDRASQKWMLFAYDRSSGKLLWERVAVEGTPRDKRHVKSTYASSTPATDGRIVVAVYGSHGLHAFDVTGEPRWSADLGRLNAGAYNAAAVEWGPASSPIIWEDLVIVQVDTQDDSFIAALDVESGKLVWKTERDEIPSWGTPTVSMTPKGPILVTNASNFIRGYNPRTGAELWRVGRSSRITAPTPFFASGLFIVASGRGPERPIFAIRPEAAGDLTLAQGETSNNGVAWSWTGRGSYMPTPIAYDGILYVLGNAGIFDAYDVATGKEIYRQRLPNPGSGFSASPVVADGKLYLSSEDGDILVVKAGRAFEIIARNSMGETLMATPAISKGTMFVRGASTLFAIGRNGAR